MSNTTNHCQMPKKVLGKEIVSDTTNHYQMPEKVPGGEIYTMNDRGNVSPVIDNMSLEFIKKICKNGKHPLEIGCAYGMVGIEAFKQGVKNYTILDLDARHVTIAIDRIKAANPENMQNLTAIIGDILTVDLPENFFDNILIARVLHFFCPEELPKALNQLHKITAPGGTVYAITNTAYMKGYESFIPIYEDRKRKGEKWPGYVDNMNEFMTKSTENEIIGIRDSYFHFLDSDILKNAFMEHNFEIIEAKDYPLEYKSDFYELDGRENAIVIARKK